MATARKAPPATELEVGGRTVRISNPDRVYFSARGETKLDLARYYLSVGDGIVRALRERPCMMHRFPEGVDGEKVHQKRLPRGAPPWVETVRVHFPRYNRDADELCVTELASVIWAVQMSTVEFHPWNSRRSDTERPDEWRIDLDPMPECGFDRVRRVAQVAREVLDELGAVGWPKTSGGSGLVLPTSAGRRWPSRERWKGGRLPRRPPPGGARTAIRRPCSSTTTRTPGITLWPAPTPCAAFPRRQCQPRSPGRRSTRSCLPTSRSRPSRRGSLHWATCTQTSITRPTRCRHCCSGQSGTNATARATPAARRWSDKAGRNHMPANP